MKTITEEERHTNLTLATRDKVLAMLALAPHTSLAHTATPTSSPPGGIIITVPASTERTALYIYCLPWARGWSIFVSPYPGENAYGWRDVPPKYADLQSPLYTPRNKTGPYNVAPTRIARALVQLIRKLEQTRPHI